MTGKVDKSSPAIQYKFYHISHYVRPLRSKASEKFRFWWTADFGITIMDGRSDWLILSDNDRQTPAVSLFRTKSDLDDWAFFSKKDTPEFEARIYIVEDLHDAAKNKHDVRLLHVALTFSLEGKKKKLEYVFDLLEGQDDSAEEAKKVYLNTKQGILRAVFNLDETEEFKGKLKEIPQDKSKVLPPSSVKMAIVPCAYEDQE